MNAMVPTLEELQLAAIPNALVIIDGNNFMFNQSPTYGDYREAGFPGPLNQSRLIEALQALLLVRQDLGVDLWFDGSEHQVEQVTERLRVILSGGSGKNRADRGILRFLEERAASPDGRPWLLVTLDKQLARRARRRGRLADPSLESRVYGVQKFDVK